MIARRFVLILIGWATLVACGCRDSVSPSPSLVPSVVAPDHAPAAVAESDGIADDLVPDVESVAVEVEAAVLESKPMSKPMSEPDVALVEPTNPIPKTDSPPIRLLLPTTAGTILVDIEFLIDGVPLVTAFEARIKTTLLDADADNDGRVSWNEFLDHLASDAQRFGRNVAGQRGQRRNMIQLQDRNSNGTVESDEAVNVLFRDAGFDAAFRLRGTDFYRGRKSESKVFAAVDQDQSGGLSESEINAASESLFRLDRNTDQRIDLAEVILPVVGDSDPAWNRRRTNRNGSVATDLMGYVDWTMMSYSINDQRQQRPFGLAEIPAGPIDQDGDGSINATEARLLKKVDPDMLLTASLESKPGGKASLAIRWMRDELQPMIQDNASASMVALADRSLGLCITLQDRPDGTLQDRPDGVNQDLAAKLPIWSVQLRGRAAEFPDVLFAFLDTDHNWMLSTREVTSATTRLQSLVVGGDELQATAIPDWFLVQIVRGDPALRDRLFQIRSATQDEESKDIPRWAKGMDANVDGEISLREFVGSAEQFGRLDTNDDGFIDVTEVHSAENAK